MVSAKKPTRSVDYVPSPVVGQEQPFNYTYLYDAFKASTEVTAVVSAIVDDVMADGYELIGDDDKVKEMEEHLRSIRFHRVLKNALYDMIITGDTYLEKVTMSKQQIIESINKLSKPLGMNKSMTLDVIKAANGIMRPFKLYNIDSSTMRIDYNELGVIKGYIQESPTTGNFTNFTNKQIIHMSYLNLGGSIYGYTHMRSIVNDIATLLFAKGYARSFFKNYGVPDWMFIVKGENQESMERNREILIESLKNGKHQNNKHKSLVITGDIEVKELNKFDKDLEFKELINTFTQRIMMAFSVPPSRISIEGKSGDQGKQGFEGYYKKINSLQIDIEDALNNLLFTEYDLQISFMKSYKIDELREAQIMSMLVDRNIISADEGRHRMGFQGDAPTPTISEFENIVPGTSGTSQVPTSSKPKEAPQKEVPENKQRPQDSKPPKKGTTADLTKSSDMLIVDFAYLVAIVEAFGDFDKQKVLYQETADKFIILFSDKLFRYKSIVDKFDIDVETFRFTYLRNAIPYTA